MISNLARIGTTIDNTVLVSSLNSNYMPSPVMDFKPYAKYDNLSSRQVRGGGLPVITWELLQVTPVQSDAIAAYCPLMTSASVFIYSRTNRTLDIYKYFSCIMRWDQAEGITGLRRESLKFEFTDCVEVTP